jgi:RNA polymerase sigma-70 factor (ECF subfamily)
VQTRSDIIAWVGSNIIPFEGELRAWLRRMRISEDEIEDVVQDAYLSIAKLSSVAHIRNGKSYFFQTAKMAIFQKLRRDRIVPIDRLIEIGALDIADVAPDPEVRTSARIELERVRRLIAALPDRCREIFELRRIEGVPQREIAARLGLPEHTIEQQATRGLKLILKAIAMEDAACEARSQRPKEMPSGARRR